MFTDQAFYLASYYNWFEFASFREYLTEETGNLVMMLQEAAEHQWDLISARMPGASDEEIGAELHRWWGQQIRRFHARVRLEKGQEKRDRLRERVSEERRGRIQAEQRLEAAEQQVDDAKRDLEIERGLTDHLQQRLCRECYGRLTD